MTVTVTVTETEKEYTPCGHIIGEAQSEDGIVTES